MYVQERIAKFTFFFKKVPQIFAYSEKSVYFEVGAKLKRIGI